MLTLVWPRSRDTERTSHALHQRDLESYTRYNVFTHYAYIYISAYAIVFKNAYKYLHTYTHQYKNTQDAKIQKKHARGAKPATKRQSKA